MPFDFNDLNRFAEETNAPSSESQYAESHSYANEAEDHVPPNATVYQTTGPNAYTKAIEAADGSGPAVNPRSCVTCRRRKVKCDKQMPCTTCRRALIPCIFPAPGRKPRQPRPRDPNAPQKNFSKREAEMVKRLKKLEGIVEELSGQIDVDASKSNSPESGQAHYGAPRRTTSHNSTRQHSMSAKEGTVSPHASVGSRDGDSVSDASDATRREKTRSQFGRMILNDHKGKTRYVSSAFWSKMNDELDSLRKEASMLTDEDSEDSEYGDTPETTPVHNQTTHDHHAFLLGYRSADVDLRKLYPIPSHGWFLWKIYQDMVEPLIKVVHVPTADTLLREASRDLESLSPGEQALVFSIFFAAVVATEPEDAERNFNTKKEDLVAQYRFSAEQALAKADFLTTTDLSVIQALVIFLIVARRFDTSRFCWAMTGLLVRLAHGMGLHRDGSLFDMTPFEIEMRRRVWWSIVKVDLRSSEELGMELTIQDRTFDTEVPMNINDADMSPDETAPLVARDGPTDMSVHLLRCEITKIARRVLGTVAAGGLGPPSDGGEALAANLEELEATLVSTHFSHMHEVIRQHTPTDDSKDHMTWMVRIITRIVMAKLSLTIYQPILFTEPDKLRPEIRQRIYVSALEILESDSRLHRDTRKHPFRWLFMTYSTWQPLAYVLVESARRSWTPLTERAWEAVCGFQRIPLEKTKKANQAAVFLPLRKLFLCVRRHRAVELARLSKDLGEAEKLVQEEEANVTAPWFAQYCEADESMARARERWWKLLKLGDNASQPSDLVQSNNFLASPQPRSADGLRGQSQSVSSGEAQQEPVNMTEAQMQYLNQFMSQTAPSVADLYNLEGVGFMGPLMSGVGGPGSNAIGSQSMSFPGPSASSSGDSTAIPSNTASVTGMGPDAMFADQATSQIMQANDQLPSFMWGNWLDETAAGALGQGGVQDKTMEDVTAPEDLNMLDQDFDWQDWTQTLKGVEMWQGEVPGAR